MHFFELLPSSICDFGDQFLHIVELRPPSICNFGARVFTHFELLPSSICDFGAQFSHSFELLPSGAACFFDFKAAFPSVSHKFLWAALRHAGIPGNIIAAIQQLYQNNAHFLRWQTGRVPLFTVSSGVKQGCPLSPTLFIVAGEVLLNCMKAHISSADMIRCYADDIAWITADLWKFGPALASAFRQIGRCTGLSLNPKKCVCLPLWQYSTPSIKHLPNEIIPLWLDFQVADKAKYLGVWLGPGAVDICWREAEAKFNERVAVIANLGLGHFRTALAFKIFAASTFGYLMQLLPIRPDWGEVQSKAFRAMVRGPADWMPRGWWSRRQQVIPLPPPFIDFETYHKASLLRVAARTVPEFPHWCTKLRDVMERDDAPLLHPLEDWYCRCIARTLCNAYEQWGGSSIEVIADEGRLQVQIYKDALLPITNRAATAAWERRLRRWGSMMRPTVPARKLVLRAGACMQVLEKAPPSTRWAVTRIWLNGWCTARRFQSIQPCLFCGKGEDSIEHLCRCRPLRELANLRLGLSLGASEPLGWLMIDGNFRGVQEVWKHALFLHGVYKAHNALRRGGTHREPMEVVWAYVRGVAFQHRELSGLI